MKLIDKDALVAEIDKEIKCIYAGREYVGIPLDEKNRVYGLQISKGIIYTLEVKEVDLEKEYKDFVEEDPVYNMLVNGIVGKAIAKHFFELGLNTQHSSINIPNIDDNLEKLGIDPYSKEAKIFKESYYMALEKLKAQKGE